MTALKPNGMRRILKSLYPRKSVWLCDYGFIQAAYVKPRFCQCSVNAFVAVIVIVVVVIVVVDVIVAIFVASSSKS